MELENALLRTELSLYQREENIRELEVRNNHCQHDLQQRRLASSKAVKQFENRIAEANKKLTHMNSELVKSQEHARRFQDLLTTERRKQKGLQVRLGLVLLFLSQIIHFLSHHSLCTLACFGK